MDILDADEYEGCGRMRHHAASSAVADNDLYRTQDTGSRLSDYRK